MATHGQTVSLKQTVFDILTENPNLTIRQVIDTLPNQNVNSIKYYYYDYTTRNLKPKRPYKHKQIVKTCPECGKKFHPTQKTHQIYCSKKCTYQHRRKNPSLRTCKKCGKKTVRLSKEGLCTSCEFSSGRVWTLDMTNWTWTKKQTKPEPEPNRPNESKIHKTNQLTTSKS